MSTIPAPLLTHYGQRVTSFAHALKLVRDDEQIFGFTSHDEAATVNGVLCSPEQGLDASALLTAAGSAVGNLELRTLNDGSLFSFADIVGGLWRNAAFQIARYNWRLPADGAHVLLSGTMGEIHIHDTVLRIELRDLRQYLQQDVGSLSSKNCRYRFGDPKCGIDLSDPTITVTGTVTSAGQQTFTDSGRTEVNDYFGNGELRWLSGNNIGQRVKIKTYASDVFTLVRPMFGTVANGDSYEAIAGCRFRFGPDCRDKWGNQLRFGAEPHRRGVNNLTRAPG